MTLEERRNRSDLVELFKISKKLSAIPLETFFERDDTSRTRGHEYKLRKKCIDTDLRKFFFSQRVVSRWNELDSDVVGAGTVETFKNRLKVFRKIRMDLLTDQQ